MEGIEDEPESNLIRDAAMFQDLVGGEELDQVERDLGLVHDLPKPSVLPPLGLTEVVKLADGSSMLRLKDMPQPEPEATSSVDNSDPEVELPNAPAEVAVAEEILASIPEKKPKPRKQRGRTTRNIPPHNPTPPEPLKPGEDGYEEGFQTYSNADGPQFPPQEPDQPFETQIETPLNPENVERIDQDSKGLPHTYRGSFMRLDYYDDLAEGATDAWYDEKAKRLIQTLDPTIFKVGEIGPHGGIVMRSDLGLTDQADNSGPSPEHILVAGYWRVPVSEPPKVEAKKEYDDLNHFVTPEWVIKACLSVIPSSPPPSMILDAGAGTGVWGEVAAQKWPHAFLVASELDPRHAEGFTVDQNNQILPTNTAYREWHKGDFLRFPHFSDIEWWRRPGQYDLVMSNPPFNQVTDFVRMACFMANPDGGRVVMILRLAILESQTRAKDFWPYYPPESITIFSKRPSFTGNGKTDSKTAYAAVVWRNGHRGDSTFRFFQPEQTDRLVDPVGRDASLIYPIGWQPPEPPEVPGA